MPGRRGARSQRRITAGPLRRDHLGSAAAGSAPGDGGMRCAVVASKAAARFVICRSRRSSSAGRQVVEEPAADAGGGLGRIRAERVGGRQAVGGGRSPQPGGPRAPGQVEREELEPEGGVRGELTSPSIQAAVPLTTITDRVALARATK